MKKILSVLIAIVLHKLAFSQANCENGYSIPTHGQVKVLLVWAEYTTSAFTSNSSVANYGSAPLPPDYNDFFDLSYTAGVEPSAYISKYFHQMSFGQHIVTCDHLDHVIQVNPSVTPFVSSGGYKTIYYYLNSLYNQNPSTFSSTYLVGQSQVSDLDRFTNSGQGLQKNFTANSKIDIVIILWKNHPNYGGGGDAIVPHGNSSSSLGFTVLGFNGIESDGAFVGNTGTGTKKFIIQEYFHALFGGNEYHTGGGAGNHTFMTYTNPWGIPAQLAGYGISNAANGWDRDRLGWNGWVDLNKTTPKTSLISALDQSGNEVNTDFTVTSSLGGGLFVLRDHVQYGDAIRIKLPHLQDDPSYPIAKNQYLWVENHQKINLYNGFDFGQWEESSPCKDPTRPGMWGFIQVGMDIKTGNSVYTGYQNATANGCASYIFPLTADGNHDYNYTDPTAPTYWPDCNWNNPYVVIDRNDPNNKENPFTGFNTLYNVWNGNGDNILSKTGGDIYHPWYAERINGNVVINGYYHGDSYDAFNFVTGKTKISLSNNPSATPVYTLATPNLDAAGSGLQPQQPYENRSIWLNGISVEILQENYQPSVFGSGALLVKVRTDEYDVNSNKRWCGNVKLSPNDLNATNYSLKLASGNSILVDRGKSYTRQFAVDQDPNTNEYRFSEPTEFTILPNAYFLMDQNTNLTIDGSSTFRIKSGGKLEINSGSNLIVKKGSSLILETGAQLIIHDNSFLKVEQGGTLFYDNSSINLAGNNAYIEFEGNLNIAANADFTFTGLGFLKFTQPGWINPSTNPSNIIAGAGSKITLIGNGINHKVLEVDQETMYAYYPLTKFTIKNGKAELNSNSRICADHDVLLQNARVTSVVGSQNNHRGFNTYGQSNITVTNSIFENGAYGFYAINTYGGAPITFTNCQFNYCTVAGLTTVDKGATISNCHFSHCLNGWVAQGMTFPCSGTNVYAQNNTNNGIDFTASGTSSLFLEKPHIDHNLFTGIYFEGSTMLTTHCGSINNNGDISITTGYGIDITNNAILNQSPNVAPYGGNNNVSANVIGVAASCANNWYSDGGRNNYQSVFRDALGTFNASCATPSISAIANQWKSTVGTPPVQGTDYVLKTCNCGVANYFNYINLDDPIPSSYVSCSVSPPPYNPMQKNVLTHGNPIEFCPTCEKITTTNYNKVRLNEAVKDALQYMEIDDTLGASTGNDTIAINRLSQILAYKFREGLPPKTKLGRDEFWLVEMALSKLKETLGRAVENHKVTASSSDANVIRTLTAIQNLQSNVYNYKESQHRELYFEIDKAAIYALVNEHTKALELLDNISGCYSLDQEQKDHIKKLKSVYFTENLVLTNKIDKENFLDTYLKVLSGTSSFNSNGLFVNSKVDSSVVGDITFVGDTVNFASSDQSLDKSWNFGDCSSSTDTNPTHIYNNQGSYEVTLSETFKCTSTDKTTNITVLAKPEFHLTQKVISEDCDGKIIGIDKNMVIDNIISSCYSNGSSLASTNNLRFIFNWDFETPFHNDFEEIFSFGDIQNDLDSTVLVNSPNGNKYGINLSIQMQAFQDGIWKNTTCQILLVDSIVNDSSFKAEINVDDIICQASPGQIKAQISGGVSPYSFYWQFGNGTISQEKDPVITFGASGETEVVVNIKDALGCAATISFPNSDSPDFGSSPDTDSIPIVDNSFSFDVPECKTISGYAVISSNCGNNPVINANFGLLQQGQEKPLIGISAISDATGYFEFSPRDLIGLDPAAEYEIVTIQPSRFIVLKPYFSLISEMEDASPLTIYLGTAKIDGVLQNTVPTETSAAMTVIDLSGNKYVASTINDNTDNYYLEKQDASGTVLWYAQYDGYASGTDSVKAVYVDSTGNVYMTGTSWNGSGYDYATLKYDSTGEIQWIDRYQDTIRPVSEGNSISEDSTGNIRVSGINKGETIIYTTIIYKDCKFVEPINARKKNNVPDLISSASNSNQVVVYPNPNRGDVLNINTSFDIHEQIKFNLYDNTGKLLYSTTLKERVESISLSQLNLANSLYYYVITGNSTNKIYQREKIAIIKEN